MRKTLLGALALAILGALLPASAAFAGPAAFAGQPGDEAKTVITFTGNAQSGSVSDGQHGRYWSLGNEDFDRIDSIVKKIEIRDIICAPGQWDLKAGYWHYWRDREGKTHRVYIPDCRCCFSDRRLPAWLTDYDRDGEWEYYIDANGVRHYFYVDPDREGEWHSYKDKDGNTQWYYEAKG